MPSLGADMTSGTVVEWLVEPGDEVRRGQVVAVVDTDKAAIEVEAYEAGVVTELVVPVGQTVAVGTVLARLRSSSPEPGAAAARDRPTRSGGSLVRARSSPLARRRARELGVGLSAVTGTGPGGAIRAADVERVSREAPEAPAAPAVRAASEVPATVPAAAPAAAPQARPVASPAQADATSRRQAAVGALMARSKRDIPHFYLGTDVDLAAATGWLHERNRSRPPARRSLPAALFLRAVTLAAEEVPHLNGHWVDGAFRPSEAVHLGVAISLRDGSLVAPAIRDAQRLDVDAVMEALRNLVVRARSGRLTREQMSDPSITVTNLGELGADTVLPVIYPPQVAMVGFGRVSDRPWAVDGMLAVRPVVSISLAADHRASDGHRAARFLQAVARRLHCPAELDLGSAP